MKTVILAGGLGTRLRDHIGELPKPMARVAGRPFLAHVLDRLAAAGLQDIVLSVGYRAESIRRHFGDAYGGARLSYVTEPEPLGTGGALAFALRGQHEPALALNGDTLLALDYPRFLAWYRDRPVDLAMAVKHLHDAARYGTVAMEGDRVTGFAEKGRQAAGWVNAGAYIVRPALFERFALSDRFSFEHDLLERHCSELAPRGYATQAYFIDIGVPEDYERAQRELA